MCWNSGWSRTLQAAPAGHNLPGQLTRDTCVGPCLPMYLDPLEQSSHVHHFGYCLPTSLYPLGYCLPCLSILWDIVFHVSPSSGTLFSHVPLSSGTLFCHVLPSSETLSSHVPPSSGTVFSCPSIVWDSLHMSLHPLGQSSHVPPFSGTLSSHVPPSSRMLSSHVPPSSGSAFPIY